MKEGNCRPQGVSSRGATAFNPLPFDVLVDDARNECQLIAYANDYLRRRNNVTAVSQEKYLRSNKVAVNRTVLSYWRNKLVYMGAHNFRISALCRFWGLSLEDMLAIGREEKRLRIEKGLKVAL